MKIGKSPLSVSELLDKFLKKEIVYNEGDFEQAGTRITDSYSFWIKGKRWISEIARWDGDVLLVEWNSYLLGSGSGYDRNQTVNLIAIHTFIADNNLTMRYCKNMRSVKVEDKK